MITGNLKEIKFPKNCKTWKDKAVHIIGTGYLLKDIDYENKTFDWAGSGVYYYDDKWYLFSLVTHDTWVISTIDNGEIEFTSQFDNKINLILEDAILNAVNIKKCCGNCKCGENDEKLK